MRSFDLSAALEVLPDISDGDLVDRAVYRLNHPEGWSDVNVQRSVESWKTLSEIFNVKIDARTLSSEIDRDQGHPEAVYGSLELELGEADVGRMNGRALEINGILDAVSLKVRDEDDIYRLGEELRSTWKGPDIPRDRYGNVIVPLIGKNVFTHKPTFQGFHIFPPVRLSDADEPGQPYALSVDLTRFGFGDHPNILSTRTLAAKRSADDSSPYAFISTLPPGDAARAQEVFEIVSAGAARAEALYGFAPGERIKGVFLTPADSWNASVRLANPELLYFWDELFEDLIGGRADSVASHELAHGIDFQFAISTHPEFLDLYKQLSKAEDDAFFSAINESNFYGGKGGHTQDNVFELFASLVNSLASPRWNDVVAAMSPRVRGLYGHALRRLRTALIERCPGFTSAPLDAILEKRIGEIDVPPIEELLMKNVSEILAEGPNPMQIVHAADFEREVVESRDPVVVILYTEGHRNLSGGRPRS